MIIIAMRSKTDQHPLKGKVKKENGTEQGLIRVQNL